MNNRTSPTLLRLSCIFFIACIIVNNKAGAQWSELGGTNALAANDYIQSICSDTAGNIYAAGYFTNGSTHVTGSYYVAKYNGTTWSELGGSNALAANNLIWSICSDRAGNIYAAGDFTNHSGNFYVAKWNDSSWSELGGTNALAANYSITSLCSDASGNVYAGGCFTNDSGKCYVAKWNGSTWSELGTINVVADDSFFSCILSVCSDPSDNIYIAGGFFNDGGLYYVAKWSGGTWSEIGDANALAEYQPILSVCTDTAGNIYAGGGVIGTISSGPGYGDAIQWNDSTWNELGGTSLAANDAIESVCSDAMGNIYAAGYFTALDTSGLRWENIGNHYVAKWNGSTWSALGGTYGLGANYPIISVCTDKANNIYAAGQFTNDSGYYYVAKYTNTPSGIEQEPNATSSLRLFPNPATNSVTIISSENIQTIKVLNQTGAVVQCIENLSGKQHILNLSNLVKGVYYVQVNEEAELQKLVVQ